MQRKYAMAAATATAAALVLAACNGGDPGSDDEGPITLDLFTDKAAWEPEFDEMNAASDAEGLQLEFTGYSDPTAYDTFIKQAFRTNDRPELFTWHTGDRLAELVDEGLLAPTTEIWDEAIANGDVPEGLAENYTFDGEQYCVPLNVVYWVMYYNMEVFAEHELEVPQTWDDLMDISQTLVENDVTPYHQMNIIFEFVWFQAILAGLDPDAYRGLADGSVSYTDPPVVEAMEIWHEMQSEGYFIDPGVTTDPQTLLQTGDVAMANFGTFFTGQLNSLDMEAEEDYGIFVIPAVDASLTDVPIIVETGPLCVGAGSENEEAALEYSRWWMGVDAQSAWTEARGDVSFNPGAEVHDPSLEALIADVTGPGYDIQMRYLEATPTPIYSVASEQFGEFVTNNDNPMGVLEAIQTAADSYWADQG